MSYAKRMTPRGEKLIGPILTAIHPMKPGESKVFEGSGEAHVNTTRSYLYNYFLLYNLRNRYRIHRISKTQIQITCLKETPMAEVILTETDTTAVQDFYLKYLVDVTTEEEALEIIRSQHSMGVIVDAAMVPIFNEWKRHEGD